MSKTKIKPQISIKNPVQTTSLRVFQIEIPSHNLLPKAQSFSLKKVTAPN